MVPKYNIEEIFRKFERKGGNDLARKIVHDITMFEKGESHKECDHLDLYKKAIGLLTTLRDIHLVGVQEAIEHCKKLRDGRILPKENLEYLANIFALTIIEDKALSYTK